METFWYQLTQVTWKMAVKTGMVFILHLSSIILASVLACLSSTAPLTSA